MPIVVGAPRSGTTLLRFMLDAHPDLAIPPETGFLALADLFLDAHPPDRPPAPDADAALRDRFFETITQFPVGAPAWPDFDVPCDAFRAALEAIDPFSVADGYRAFYRLYAARLGKPRWGDKTPLYCEHLAPIARLLPEAHFVHIIRDGRDVALSLRRMWFSPGSDIETLAGYWRRCVTTARAQAAASGAPYVEVRFEDLVADARAVLEPLAAFLQLPFDTAMLAYHAGAATRLAEHGARIATDGRTIVSRDDRVRQQALTMQPPQAARVAAWQREMSDEEQERFRCVAGDLLTELGYPG